MIDYNNVQKQSAVPKASSMIETFRAIGYSLETAIADVIDNSISAGAKNININRVWRGGESIISIEDDGCGMNNDELVQALCPGAQNPLMERNETDLGRFGLGLKTASFSQCRKLSVISRKNDYAPVYWTWDLDYVAQCDEWELIKWIPEEFKDCLNDKKSGTIVIWSDLDRIVSMQTSTTDERAKLKFSEALDRVKKHVAMTFHRFIEEKSVKILWCGHEIEPWNPFCTKEDKTQEKPTDYIHGGGIMKGYVLPHKNNFSSEEAYKKAEGINGWGAQQGFYVYRGKRLLLAGDWLGIRRKEEHYKLVRIQIDLPNTLDSEWQIDIKKSRAYPPSSCKEQLASYARTVCADGCEVYRHRGKIIRQRAGNEFQPLWLEKKKDNRWYFVVNRDHSVVQRMKEYAEENPVEAIDTLLKLIEETIPSKSIYINEAQNEETQKAPFSDIDIDMIKETIKMLYDYNCANGMSPNDSKEFIKRIEPFNNFEDIIDNI